MEAHLTDALAEVRKVAATAAVEEQEIRDLEHEIAEQLRQIAADLFGGATQYRLPKTKVMDDCGQTTVAVVYRRIGAHLGFVEEGESQLRMTTNGGFVRVIVLAREDEGIDDVLDGSIAEPGRWHVNYLYKGTCRKATDQEIADHAPALAEQLIAALKKRVDTARDHKATLARVRDAMAGGA